MAMFIHQKKDHHADFFFSIDLNVCHLTVISPVSVPRICHQPIRCPVLHAPAKHLYCVATQQFSTDVLVDTFGKRKTGFFLWSISSSQMVISFPLELWLRISASERLPVKQSPSNLTAEGKPIKTFSWSKRNKPFKYNIGIQVLSLSHAVTKGSWECFGQCTVTWFIS